MSADFLPYINLRPLDITPAQIYIDSIEVARTVFPDFDLRPGTIEDAMFQAFAFMSSLNIGSINRLPDSLMLGIGKMLGTPYVDGTRATMDVTFTANSNDGATVPTGTLVTYTAVTDDGETSIAYSFETNEALVIAANSVGDPLPTGTVACTARNIGIIPPIPSGTAMRIDSFSQTLYSAESSSNFAQGSDAETIDEFLTRSVGNLSSMSSALTTANQLKNYILVAYPNLAKRCKVYDLTDRDGLFLISDANSSGKVVAFVYGPERNLTTTEITDLELDISERIVAGLEVGVENPYLLNFKVTASVNYFSDFDATNVSDVIKQNLLTQFSPTYSQWTEDKLRQNDVLRIVYSNPAVHSVDSITVSKTDSATITGAVKSVNVTGAVRSGSGASQTVTYTVASHPFAIGDLVTVTGITPSGLNCTSLSITAVTSTTFTVVNASATGTYSSGGSATTPNVTYTANNTFSVGDRVVVTGITASTLNSPTVSITGAVRSGTGTTSDPYKINYTVASHSFVVGDVITVTGISPSGLNCTNCPIIETTTTTFKVINASATGTYSSGGSVSTPLVVVRRDATTFTATNSTASGSYSSGGTGTLNMPYWGSVSGNDINYLYKGSLLNLQPEKIVLTLTSFSI